MHQNKENINYFEISEINDKKDLPINSWKVRPCEWYKEEYKDCKSIRARFHQYFIFGDKVDCSQWKSDFENCVQFRKKGDLKSLEMVVESETERKERRDETMKNNDVWEYRAAPPDNWNSTMPDWMVEDKKDSLLIETQNMLSKGIQPKPIFTGLSCSIM